TLPPERKPLGRLRCLMSLVPGNLSAMSLKRSMIPSLMTLLMTNRTGFLAASLRPSHAFEIASTPPLNLGATLSLMKLPSVWNTGLMTLFQTDLIALPMLSHTGLMMLLYSHLKIGPSTSRTKLRTALNTGLTVVFHHVLMIAPMSRKIAWNVSLSHLIVGHSTFFQNVISALKITLTPAHQVEISAPM